jgi:hypothetical protein
MYEIILNISLNVSQESNATNMITTNTNTITNTNTNTNKLAGPIQPTTPGQPTNPGKPGAISVGSVLLIWYFDLLTLF